MEQMRADLHVHVDGAINKENIINALKKAERDGCKKFCLLEHNNLNVLEPICEIIKEGSLRDYYSGELFLGCEYDNIIDAHHQNSDGSCYDGFVSHILVYMPFEDALKLKQDKILHARNKMADYAADYKKLMERIDELGDIPKPTMEELISQETPHIVKDLQKWVTSDRNRRIAYLDALQTVPRVIDYPSDFIRNLAQNPNGKLFYKPEGVPYSSELLKIIRTETPEAKVILAHPAWMQASFNMENYLETMMSLDEKVGQKAFDGIEVCYYLNSKEEQDFLEKYATERNLLQTAGSDSIKVDGEMYYMHKGEKFFFVPEFGNAMGTAFDMGNIEVMPDGDKNVIHTVKGGSPLVVESQLFEDIKVDENEAKEILNAKQPKETKEMGMWA